ncbi:Carbonic anhydrase-related protein 10 [Eufriesea mexicana]|uniref:Carbonic anhydrase-related protein 10 n=1 Tax=Eufriesea mexicana TaxID=516756 RepID=A0A310S6C7_9HYME|nr:Carbonic anhydrase-related protein 10 [Eufriesea mexicana]
MTSRGFLIMNYLQNLGPSAGRIGGPMTVFPRWLVGLVGGRVNRCSKVAFDVSFNRLGFEGPGFWGLINPDWWLCHKGRRQSPVNLEPSRLLFDPNLQPLHVDKHKVGGVLANTGHSVAFAVDNDTRHPVNISGGPLSYRYQFHEIHLHFGSNEQIGSEHTVDGHAFPAECLPRATEGLVPRPSSLISSPGESSFTCFLYLGGSSPRDLPWKLAGEMTTA